MSDAWPQLWNPFRRPRGRPREDLIVRTRRAGWFWLVLGDEDDWARHRDQLRGLEHKSHCQSWMWPSFTPEEMACRHCGQFYSDPVFIDALQAARDRVGRPFHILSAHRCALHNARVGGAPRSQHLRLAVDIALRGHDRHALHQALRHEGFTGFGFYQTFIHADMGSERSWYGSQRARRLWQA